MVYLTSNRIVTRSILLSGPRIHFLHLLARGLNGAQGIRNTDASATPSHQPISYWTDNQNNVLRVSVFNVKSTLRSDQDAIIAPAQS